MSTINVWSSVAVDVQTVLGAAKTVTAITKASPAVASSTAHGFTNGDYVLIECSGMLEANNRVVRVASSTTDTFAAEALDSTLFTTFTSGTASKITFGASAATFQDVNGSGGEPAVIDITTIHDSITKEIPGVKSAISYSFGSLWDPADAALVELKKADDVKGKRAVRLGFASGSKVAFYCYPTASLTPTGASGAPVTTPVSFKVIGPISAWTT